MSILARDFWSIMPQDLVCVDSHVPGKPHFSIFYNCQGLTDIPSVNTILIPAYFLQIFQSTRRANLSGCFLYPFWTSFLRSLRMCHTVLVDSRHIICLIELAASIKEFENPFLSHLQGSSLATSDACWTNFPCKPFFFFSTFSSFILLS